MVLRSLGAASKEATMADDRDYLSDNDPAPEIEPVLYNEETRVYAVSYTHLTLPTSDLV